MQSKTLTYKLFFRKYTIFQWFRSGKYKVSDF